jgi:hypothetical protein
MMSLWYNRENGNHAITHHGEQIMRYGMECMNPSCVERGIELSSIKCPSCGTTDIETCRVPENGDDVKILRADYNRRNANTPGFVPSVEYVLQPDGTTKPRVP